MKDFKDLKVAIVHDWLVGGGAERVVEELHKMFPDAPIYTSYATAEWRKKLDGRVVTGFLQRWPFPALRKFVPFLRVWWFSHLDLSGYDLVISSTGNGEAKDIRVPAGGKHICYCHSPVHFYWRHYDKYLQNPGFGIFDPLARLALKVFAGPLRRRDYKAAQRPDVFIANSEHIRSDIKKYYGRDSTVIHPPVDIDRFINTSPAKDRYDFITVGRQVPHKHTEIIVEACTDLDIPLKVIGSGPEHRKLVKMAGPSVTLLQNVSDSELAGHLASAQAFIFASYEDFGISPVEAMAVGLPVIAYKAGGALDYVVHGKTGEFFEKQTAESLAKTIKVFRTDKYSSGDIKTAARKFTSDTFQKKFFLFLKDVIQ